MYVRCVNKYIFIKTPYAALTLLEQFQEKEHMDDWNFIAEALEWNADITVNQVQYEYIRHLALTHLHTREFTIGISFLFNNPY